MAELNRVSINNRPSLNSNISVVDRSTGRIVFLSLIGYQTEIKETVKLLKENVPVYIKGYGTYQNTPKQLEVKVSKPAGSDFTHLIAYRKDEVIKNEQNGNEMLLSYIFAKDIDELKDRVFEKISKNTAIPLIKDWMSYLIDFLRNRNALEEKPVNFVEDTAPFHCFYLHVSTSDLIQIISQALTNKTLTIDGCEETSTKMENIQGLDAYLNGYSEILASRIQNSFVPRFNPDTDDYTEPVHNFDDACYHAGITLFPAQKSVIQASVNNLDHSNMTFVIGEMGSGKTALGCGITYAHGKQLGKNTIIMCPSHLTNKWKREIERLVPNGTAYIVKDLSDLIEIEHLIFNKNKKENVYVIMSKESAKFGYEKCPAAIWSKSKKAFVCPECGQILTKKVTEGEGRNKMTFNVPLTKTDMSKPYAFNQICPNEIRVWNSKTHVYEEKKCNTKLWKPLNKEDFNNTEWLKLGSEGWILKEHVQTVYDELFDKEEKTRAEIKKLTQLGKQLDFLEENAEFDVQKRAPRKFPLAEYIKKYWKGHIDYLVADELHLLKAESEQGYAFADLIAASKKTIGLTGTLLNGYADGLFYLLYRTAPGLMLKYGFKYSDEAEFMTQFGVNKKSSTLATFQGRVTSRIGNVKTKRLPGVSPLVFTQFLLENAVFLSLSDMSEGLPSYTETPIGVEMDTDLRNAYNTLESDIRRNLSFRSKKVLGTMLQTLSAYPDMPYNQPPVCHPDTGAILATPTELSQGPRNKEQALLDLVREKIENNEKVLVFYQWTNRTDVATKLTQMIEDELDIKVAVLESKIAPDKREAWFEQKAKDGVQVVLCNPTLVETGLDLMDFTSIVFYQVGYNIFTMRQASRRSWRLGQQHPINVYFMYYYGTIQEQALSLMATKLQASMAIEGKFSEEGLRAMSNNDDLLTQIANSVVNGITESINANSFSSSSFTTSMMTYRKQRTRKPLSEIIYSEPIIKVLTATQQLFMSLCKRETHIGNLL